MPYQNPEISWFKKCFLALSVGFATIAGAHETDQHTLPEGRQFAEVGPLLSRWHYRAIKGGVDKVNAEIKEAIAHHAGEAELRRLQDPDTLVRAVNKQFPWAMDVIEGWDSQIRSEKWADEFPGYVVGYKQPIANIYQHTHNPLDPRQFFRLFLASTLKAYGHSIGTDKIGHFTDEGMNYYNVYHKARVAGVSEDDAVKKAIFLGTDDFLLGEKGMLGLLTAGDYSNGDLTSNWLGFSFYRNLTQPWSLQGKMQPAMCEREGQYWKLAPHVRIDSNFFQVFVCDAEDEALNPGFFEPGMRPALRRAIHERREAVLEHYVDEHGCRRNKEWFDAKLETFQTYYGAYYGHAGKYDELVAIGNTLFGPVQADAKVDARDEGGMTPLHTAAWSGNADLVREFLKRGSDANSVVHSDEDANADWGNTPLHYAAASGSVETVRALLGAGANVNARNNLGVTPLHRAIRSPEIARMLIERGAKIEAVDARGRTPLHWAANDSIDCHVTAIALIAKGALPDVRDHEGRTPLHLAADAGCDAVARELLRAGADINAADNFHETPLHLASSHEASSMETLLVRGGAKVNATDSFGCTALHDAARVGAAENLAMLLNAGASPSVADAFGSTPLEVAAEHGCETPVGMLRSSEPGNVRVAGHRQAAER